MNIHRIFKVVISYSFILFSSSFFALANEDNVNFSKYYDLIYQIRVISSDAGSKSSIGSGFQVTPDGLIVTNFHVISEYVNSPSTHKIQYVTQNGIKGDLELLNFDVVSDLAVLRHPAPANNFFLLSDKKLQKGDFSYALGNPSDFGIVLIPGPTNGLVEHSFEERILFSGSLNPGMSGGPSLDKEGKIIGVNVATAGSQLSFFVPVSKVKQLISQNQKLDKGIYQSEIASQIKQWQKQRIQPLIDNEWPQEVFDTRALFGEIRYDFQCWGQTNEKNKERVIITTKKNCRSGDNLYLGYGLNAGQIVFSFEKSKALKVNRFQFGAAMTTYLNADNRSNYYHSTNYKCHKDYIHSNVESDSFHRVTTCIRAYKKLIGLYDSLLLLEEHSNSETFISHLSLSAVEKDQMQKMNKKFLEGSL